MYVYRFFDKGCYTVGHYEPGGEWIPESDWPTAEEAAERVHYLKNGGKAMAREKKVIEYDYKRQLLNNELFLSIFRIENNEEKQEVISISENDSLIQIGEQISKALDRAYLLGFNEGKKEANP